MVVVVDSLSVGATLSSLVDFTVDVQSCSGIIQRVKQSNVLAV